jgi:hypothetical protein
VVEEATLDRCQRSEAASQPRKDAPERASPSSADLFSSALNRALSPGTDIAQRLVVLSLAGLVDELDWASC